MIQTIQSFQIFSIQYLPLVFNINQKVPYIKCKSRDTRTKNGNISDQNQCCFKFPLNIITAQVIQQIRINPD